jgi:predicted Fe-Mo cluster-binding NifX family protein
LVQIPDVVAYPINEAKELLNQNNYEVVIVESYGKTTIKTQDARVIRQRTLSDKEIELVISFF